MGIEIAKNTLVGFLVDLSPELHRRLQDESIRRGREEGRRVPMTEIVRDLIDRHLPRDTAGPR